LDIIWSEGAIYNMGFEHGVCEWKEFLKPGGYMALSEITWLTHSRPKEIELHWSTEYPEIDTASHIMCILEKNGFSPIAYFVFPESCWIENYYLPMEKRFDVFLERHHYHEMAIKIVQAEKDEIRKYKEYKDYFGYGFYIARKIG
jgi:SAM-dependent methyltransferase